MKGSRIGSRTIEEFIPWGRRLLVKRDRMMKGGKVLLPSEVQQDLRPATGVVLSVGDEVEGIEVGDAVAYSMYGGAGMIRDAVRPLERQDEEWKVLELDEIFGVWPGAGNGEGQETCEDSSSGDAA